MIFSDIETEVRDVLFDSETSYRFDLDDLLNYTRDGVNDIYRRRPDAQIADAGITTFTGLYDYLEAGGHDEYTSGYNLIRGWDRRTNSALYFGCPSDTDEIKIYISSANRAADTNEQAKVDGCDTPGKQKRIVAQNSSGWSGSIMVDSTPTVGDTWEAGSEESEIPLSEVQFRDALVYYVAYRCFNEDDDETHDGNQATKYFQLYKESLGVA
jgi:hypothetical protein